MQKILFLFLALAVCTAHARTGSPLVSVDHVARQIVARHSSKLVVRLMTYGLTREKYGKLSVLLEPDADSSSEDLKRFQTRLDGYPVRYAITQPLGAVQLTVPILEVDTEIQALSGPIGPVVSKEWLVSKSQYRALEKAILAGEAVAAVAGQFRSSLFPGTLAELEELEPTVCQEVYGSNPKVGDALSAPAFAAPAALSGHYNHSTTRARALRDLRDNCFEVDDNAKINSFKSLMELRVQPIVPTRKLYGATQSPLGDYDSPIDYSLDQKVEGTK